MPSKQEDRTLYNAFQEDVRVSAGASHYIRNSGRYPLCGCGDINMYAVFAENMRNSINDTGRVGCIVPSGIATDDTTKFFFRRMVDSKSLVSLFDFENRQKIFSAVDSRMKFSLLTTGNGKRPLAEQAEFVFFAHSTEELHDPERRFSLSPADIAQMNPNTRTCPIFRSRKDAELTRAVYRRVPVLIREAVKDKDGNIVEEEQNPWGVSFRQGLFNMTSDSDLFRTRVLELTYTAWDMQDFARDLGYDGPPFSWDDERRFRLRAELDALFFHLYLPATPDGYWQRAEGESDADFRALQSAFPTPRTAVDYVMETFPIRKKKDLQEYGSYPTKEEILRVYDAMQEAMRSGRGFESPLYSA